MTAVLNLNKSVGNVVKLVQPPNVFSIFVTEVLLSNSPLGMDVRLVLLAKPFARLVNAVQSSSIPVGIEVNPMFAKVTSVNNEQFANK